MATIAGRYDASGETVKAAEVLFGPLLGRDLGLRLWNGTSVPAPPQTATLVLNAPYAIRTAFSAPLDLNPGRAFVKGIIDVEGDLESAIDVLMRAAGTHDPLRLGSIALRLSRLPKEPSDERGPQRRLLGRRHSKERDAQAIAHHYDLPLRFFETFLGRSLVYSCAYYEREHMSLDEAQEAKLDLICRKLLLSRGEQLLDIGCGWGSLVIHAARRYGVRALGITASESQAREARRRVEEAGLSDCVRIERRDYRDLRGERFDKIASVGMIEHVGIKKLPGYFDAAFRALRAGGLFLNHGISDKVRVAAVIARAVSFTSSFFRMGNCRRSRACFVRPKRAASRFETSRTCANTTRARCATGSTTSSTIMPLFWASSTRRRIGSGGCTWRAARKASTAAGWVCRRSCSPDRRRMVSRACRRHARTFTLAMPTRRRYARGSAPSASLTDKNTWPGPIASRSPERFAAS